jgi:hypothetical protein
MNVAAKYKRRHSLPVDNISFDKGSDHSTVAVFRSYSCEEIQTSGSIGASFESSRLQSSQTQPLQAGRWRIEETEVSELPEIYPRLSFPLIVRGREVSEIGDNLWAFLRVNDVRSAYDREEGKVLCRTDQVSFVVQFWRRRIAPSNATIFPATAAINNGTTSTTSNDNTEEEFILEIQRRKGCSWTMQKIRSALKKSILRQQQQQLPNNRHHENPSFFFSPTTKRSNKYNGIGSIRYEPLLLPCSHELSIERTTPKGVLTRSFKGLLMKEIGVGSTTCEKPGARSIPSTHHNTKIFPYGITAMMPSLPPKFGVCPKPHWRQTEPPPQPF